MYLQLINLEYVKMARDILTFIFFLFPLFFITTLFVYILSSIVKYFDFFITYRMRSFIKKKRRLWYLLYRKTIREKKILFPSLNYIFLFSCLSLYYF
jgi:hypothetical protein